jgi:hypothetical protein
MGLVLPGCRAGLGFTSSTSWIPCHVCELGLFSIVVCMYLGSSIKTSVVLPTSISAQPNMQQRW